MAEVMAQHLSLLDLPQLGNTPAHSLVKSTHDAVRRPSIDLNQNQSSINSKAPQQVTMNLDSLPTATTASKSGAFPLWAKVVIGATVCAVLIGGAITAGVYFGLIAKVSATTTFTTTGTRTTATTGTTTTATTTTVTTSTTATTATTQTTTTSSTTSTTTSSTSTSTTTSTTTSSTTSTTTSSTSTSTTTSTTTSSTTSTTTSSTSTSTTTSTTTSSTTSSTTSTSTSSTTTSTSTTTTRTTTSTTTTSTSSTTATTTTTTTTTTTPSSMTCSAVNTNSILGSNQFIYSPSELYAAGMLNNQFGVYAAYTNGNVTSTSLWLAPQTSTPAGAFFAAQLDRNLVVYASNSAVLWTANIYISGVNAAFCLQMLNSGNLIWTNSTNSIIWQTNTAVSG